MSKRSKPLLAGLVALPATALVALIRVYQGLISPVLPLLSPHCGCRFSPTCSQYAAEAVRRHGAVAGTWLALRRLLKCTPLHPGGFDPVPDSLRTNPPALRPGHAFHRRRVGS